MRYDLGFHLDYVPNWGIREAIRELLQNVIDAETEDSTNTAIFERNGDTLTLGNAHSILERQNLLVGFSGKRDNKELIGRHGEGFKVALLVLLRNGKQVTFFNRGANEVWYFSLKKSRKYQSTIVTIDIQKHVFEGDDKSLHMVVTNLTDEDYNEIDKSHIFRVEVGTYETDPTLGRILSDPEYRGKVYVKGLYVLTNKDLHYGYDLAPKSTDLDRDRRLMDTVDLAFLTSELWVKSGKNRIVADLIAMKALDVNYVQYMTGKLSQYELKLKQQQERKPEAEKTESEKKQDDSEGVSREKLEEQVTEAFKEEYGENAIAALPSQNISELVKSNPDKEVKVVAENQYAYLKEEVRAKALPLPPLKQAFEDWLQGVTTRLTDEEIDSFGELLARLPN